MAWEQMITTAVQSLAQWGAAFFDPFFIALTALAEDGIMIVVVFAVYWCFNKELGEFMMLSVFTSIAANGVIKDIVRRPRPFLTEGYSVRYLRVENALVDTVSLHHSFSFPSGHSQCAAGLWSALAVWFRKRVFWVVAVLVTLGVMTSRVYLGVHFPGDVVVGALLGWLAALLCGYLWHRFSRYKLWLFAAAVALLLPSLFLEPSADTAKTLGVGLGALSGFFIEQRYINFKTDCKKLHKLWRLLLGVALVLLFRLGLKVVFPQTVFFDALRYAATGFAATGIVPWLFARLGI